MVQYTTQRLGSSGDAKDIIDHSFFQSIEWDDLYEHERYKWGLQSSLGFDELWCGGSGNDIHTNALMDYAS